MLLGAAVMFFAGMFAGMTLDRRLMGEPVLSAEEDATEAIAPPKHQVATTRPRNRRYDMKALLPEGDYDPGSPELLDAVAERVRKVLDLSEAQAVEVRGLIEELHPRMEEVRRHVEPELRKLALEAMTKLWPILDDRQREQMAEMLGEHGRWLVRAVGKPADTEAGASEGAGASKAEEEP